MVNQSFYSPHNWRFGRIAQKSSGISYVLDNAGRLAAAARRGDRREVVRLVRLTSIASVQTFRLCRAQKVFRNFGGQ